MSDNRPDSSQPPYGQTPTPYGSQPAYGAQPDYGSSQPDYGAQPAYASQPYGAQDYAAPQQHSGGYGAQQYGAPEPKRGKGLGISAIILAAAAFVIGLILAIWAGALIAPYANDAVAANPNLMPEDVAIQVGLLVFAMLLPSLLGLVAIIVSIIAIVKKRGRGLGIGAIIIAVLAPVICIVAMGASGVMGAI